MSGLPREVLKWLQSLDLTWQVKNPKWDLTNGYLTAEIFSWYFPQEIQMHSFYNRCSLELKLKNWYILKNFIKSKRLDIPDEYVEGTIHCKEGAAPLLIERMYEILTNRRLKKVPSEANLHPDFTDYPYQSKLPMHCRSTAAQAVKNNLRATEIMADQNLILSAQKAQKIINDHIDHRRVDRLEHPKRFDIKPTMGELCVRKPPLKQGSHEAPMDDDTDMSGKPIKGMSDVSLPPTREPSVHFKEIQVHQMDKSALYNMPIHGV